MDLISVMLQVRKLRHREGKSLAHPDPSSKATLWVNAQHEGARSVGCFQGAWKVVGGHFGNVQHLMSHQGPT